MALISNLDINIKGQTGGLDGALDRAGAGLGKFRQRVNQQCAAVNTSLSTIGNGVSNTLANALQNPVSALQSLAGVIGNALLHPISTAKNLITGLVSTCRAVGDSILATFKGIGAGLFSFIWTPASLVARTLATLFTVPFGVISAGIKGLASAWNVMYQAGQAVAGLLAGAFAAPFRIIGAGIAGLYGIIKPIVIPIITTGIGLVRAAITSIPTAAKYVVSVMSSGLSLVRAALASIPAATRYIVSVGLSGLGIVKAGIASLYTTVKPILVNVASTGISIIKAGLAGLYGMVKPLLIPLSLTGLSFITPLLGKIGTAALGLLKPFATVQSAVFAIGQDLAKTIMLASPVAAAIGHALMPNAPLIVAAIGQVWGYFTRFAGALVTTFAPQIAFVANLFSGLYQSIKPVVVSVAMKGFDIARNALVGLWSVVRPIVLPLALTGLSMVRGLIDTLRVPVRILVNLALQGYAAVKAAITSIPAAGRYLVSVAMSGLSLVRAAIASIPAATRYIVSVGLAGLAVVKSALAGIYTTVKPILVNVVATGIGLVRNALASIYTTVKPILVNVVATGIGLVRSALTSLYGIIKPLVIKITTTGIEVVKAALTGISKVPSILVKVGSIGLDVLSKGISGVRAGISALASGGIAGFAQLASSCWAAIPSVLSLDAALAPISVTIGAVAIAAAVLVGVVGGVGIAFTILASKQATVIADMYRTAKVLGMTTEAFSALANTAGIDTEQFTSGLEHLERTLSEAATGGGEAAQALARVGLSAQQLSQTNPNDQLNAIANAMQGVTNQADRLRLAHQLFGRGAGPEFVAALQNGSAGLDAFRERAERFGLTFTAAQAETIKRSNKAWSEWSLGLTGIGRSLAVALAPAWEYVGTVLGNFFGKIAGWVKSSLPYLEMVWTVTKEVLDDISDALAPVKDWFVSAFEGVGSWIGSAIMGAVPFVREAWNIIKAITSVTWNAISAVITAVVGVVRPVIASFCTWVANAFRDLGASMNINSWSDFKDAALKALITLEFGITRWKDVGTLAWDMLKLKALEWVQQLSPVLQGFENFINALIDGFNSMTRGIARTFGNVINGIISSYNSVADTLGMDRINVRVNVDARQLDHVHLAVANVGDTIAELRQTIANELGAISTDLAAFVDQRLQELNRVAQQVQNQIQQTQGMANAPIQKIDNKGAERGSAEAYSIMVGQQGDKMYNVLNDILREARAAGQLDREQLQELRRRATLAVARF